MTGVANASIDQAIKSLQEPFQPLDADGHLVGVSREALKVVLAEVGRLRERLGPHGLEVVMIGDVGHYVSAAVKAEIERLRAQEARSHRARPGPVIHTPTSDLDAAPPEIEKVIMRRLRENRIEGYTLEMAREIAGLWR